MHLTVLTEGVYIIDGRSLVRFICSTAQRPPKIEPSLGILSLDEGETGNGVASKPQRHSPASTMKQGQRIVSAATVVGETNTIASNSCGDMYGSNRPSPVSVKSSRSMCATRS